MNDFRKSLIAFFVAATFLVAPPDTFAYTVSGCGGCGAAYFYTCADRFCDEVDSFPGWSQTFCLGCADCSEDYYKSSSSGGSENSWIDASDIHFRNSHCTTAWDAFWGMNLSGIPFTDGTVTPGEAFDVWGDNDAEWIASKCCSLLRDSSKGYWATTMDGLHLLLGYKTSSYGATNFGRTWARKMEKTTIHFLWWTWTFPGQTVTQAWFNTTDETQPAGTVARVLAETNACYNDHLWGQGSVLWPDPVDDAWYWWWDHTAGSPEYLFVNDLREMNVYEVAPRTVDEKYVKQIGAAFGLTGEVGDLCDSFIIINDKQVLEVSKASGHFYFHDDSKLFVADLSVGQFPPTQAFERADSFLRQNELLPNDAGDHSVEFDTLTEENEENGEIGKVLYQNTNVVYARQLPGDPIGKVMVSVAGAGARIKVYLSEDGDVMGGMGNWRNVINIGAIPVMKSDDAKSFFDRYGEAISIVKAQALYDETKVDLGKATQAYYEHTGRARQHELVPCWILQDVEFFMEGQPVVTADVFIPASESYFPPVATIIKPAEFQTFDYGEPVGFDCQVEEGFGTPPYNFLWESNVDGQLSTQQRFTSSSLSVRCPDQSCDCSPLPHTIRLTVTDAKGSESNDSVQITILGECDECAHCGDVNKDSTFNFKDVAGMADGWLSQSGHTGPR